MPCSYPISPVGCSTFSLQRNPFVSDDSGHLLVPPPGSHSSQANSWFLTPSLLCWGGCPLLCQSSAPLHWGPVSSLTGYSGMPLEPGPSSYSLGCSRIQDYLPNQLAPCSPPGMPGSYTLFLLWGGPRCPSEGSVGTQFLRG